MSEGRDRHVNDYWEEIRALGRPAGGTVGIQMGGAGLCLGEWRVGGGRDWDTFPELITGTQKRPQV